MAMAAASRSVWVSGAVLLLVLWFLLQSSSLWNPTSPVNEQLHPGPQNIEITAGEVNDIKIGADIFRPGDTIPASAWEHGTHASLNGAPDNDLYEAERKKKPSKPVEELPPSQECPVCPEPEEPAVLPSPEHTGTKITNPDDRPLILYAYYESDFGRQNLQFFMDHGLHYAADFVFIINGESDVDKTIIFMEEKMPSGHDRRNVKVKKRDNTCFDLGAHAEVLNGIMGGPGWYDLNGPIGLPKKPPPEGQEPGDKRPLKERYKRYILMNASIRGPFVPLWSKSCWSDAYLDKVTDKIKMVGMSYNCHTNRGHVQSMIWATDSLGLDIILTPEGIDECFANMPAAQNGEIRTTQLLRDNGYDVDVFLSVYHSKDVETKQNILNGQDAEAEESESDSERETKEAESNSNTEGKDANSNLDTNEKDEDPNLDPKIQNTDSNPDDISTNEQDEKEEPSLPQKRQIGVSSTVPGDFWKFCTDEDWLGPGSYFGTFVHPYENLFMKSHRHIEDTVLDRLTEWHDGAGYSSYDVCF